MINMHNEKYTTCMSSLQLKPNMQLKNRIYFAPMGIDNAHTDGTASNNTVEFYKGIIDGGCGMVILGNASISPETRLQKRGLCLHNKKHAEALRPMIEYGKSKNCEVVIQLQHYGAQGGAQYSSKPLLSPSGIPCAQMSKKSSEYKVSEMTIDDITLVRKEFVRAAGLAMDASARMIQIQASNGYLISSFLSPYTNKRDDSYGGSAEKRMTLLYEIVTDIKNAFPSLGISIRLGIDDCLDSEGQLPHIIAPHVNKLRELGAVLITCSISIAETFHALLTPTDHIKERLKKGLQIIRSSTSMPIGFTGFVSDLFDAENYINSLHLDLIGMTRSLFADNDLITKCLEGRESEVNQCRYDGYCFRDKGNAALDRVYCCVNPKYIRPNHINYN